MTLPPMVRVFFAIDLCPDTKKMLGELICSLKKKAKTHAIRWTRPENLHITLQFLPEVKSVDITTLLGNVNAEIKSAKHFLSHLKSLQLFPNPYRPRVIVVDLDQQEQLSSLSKLIAHGIEASHYPTENRDFRGHLTLGRIKHAHGVKLDFLHHVALPDIGAIQISEIKLFRSEPQSEGSVYTPIDSMALLD